VEEHGELARSMCAAQQGDDVLAYYPWATAGVAVTQMLATFFELMQPSGVTGSFLQARRGFWACVFAAWRVPIAACCLLPAPSAVFVLAARASSRVHRPSAHCRPGRCVCCVA
jgi:hypothetical protein